MKFKRKIRQPKKAKKVTLARIREIVKEELELLKEPIYLGMSNNLRATLGLPKKEGVAVTFETSSIRPVSPPPRVSTRKLSIFPPLPLPDCFEDEEENNLNAPCW